MIGIKNWCSRTRCGIISCGSGCLVTKLSIHWEPIQKDTNQIGIIIGNIEWLGMVVVDPRRLRVAVELIKGGHFRCQYVPWCGRIIKNGKSIHRNPHRDITTLGSCFGASLFCRNTRDGIHQTLGLDLVIPCRSLATSQGFIHRGRRSKIITFVIWNILRTEYIITARNRTDGTFKIVSDPSGEVRRHGGSHSRDTICTRI